MRNTWPDCFPALECFASWRGPLHTLRKEGASESDCFLLEYQVNDSPDRFEWNGYPACEVELFLAREGWQRKRCNRIYCLAVIVNCLSASTNCLSASTNCLSSNTFCLSTTIVCFSSCAYWILEPFYYFSTLFNFVTVFLWLDVLIWVFFQSHSFDYIFVRRLICIIFMFISGNFRDFET